MILQRSFKGRSGTVLTDDVVLVAPAGSMLKSVSFAGTVQQARSYVISTNVKRRLTVSSLFKNNYLMAYA
jgi:hypothetical protein